MTSTLRRKPNRSGITCADFPGSRSLFKQQILERTRSPSRLRRTFGAQTYSNFPKNAIPPRGAICCCQALYSGKADRCSTNGAAWTTGSGPQRFSAVPDLYRNPPEAPSSSLVISPFPSTVSLRHHLPKSCELLTRIGLRDSVAAWVHRSRNAGGKAPGSFWNARNHGTNPFRNRLRPSTSTDRAPRDDRLRRPRVASAACQEI